MAADTPTRNDRIEEKDATQGKRYRGTRADLWEDLNPPFGLFAQAMHEPSSRHEFLKILDSRYPRCVEIINRKPSSVVQVAWLPYPRPKSQGFVIQHPRTTEKKKRETGDWGRLSENLLQPSPRHTGRRKEKAIGHTRGDANANSLGVFFILKGKTQDNRAILISEISSTAGFSLIVKRVSHKHLWTAYD